MTPIHQIVCPLGVRCGRVRCRRHRHPVITSVHLQSSMTSQRPVTSAQVRRRHRAVSRASNRPAVSQRDVARRPSTAPSSVVCGYSVVDRPRPRADLSVNHGDVLVMSAADVRQTAQVRRRHRLQSVCTPMHFCRHANCYITHRSQYDAVVSAWQRLLSVSPVGRSAAGSITTATAAWEVGGQQVRWLVEVPPGPPPPPPPPGR